MKTVISSIIVCIGILSACTPAKIMPSFNASDTILFEVISPDEKHIATAFVRDVGATADYSTIINVRDKSSTFDPETGRIFIASGKHSVQLLWTDGTNLSIAYNIDSKDIFKRTSNALNSIAITYQEE